MSIYPDTPDGKYFVVKGRLWRKSDPRLFGDERERLVSELMSARRAVRDAKGKPDETATARQRVEKAKVQLGERGPVWWTDGEPDQNRKLVENSTYAAWYRETMRSDHEA